MAEDLMETVVPEVVEEGQYVVVFRAEPGRIIENLSGLKEWLDTQMEPYKDFQLTESNLKEAKSIRAKLNKTKEQLETERKRLHDEYEKEYTDFYEQFDVPIHFIAGKHDSIVPSTQVFRHYTKLLPVLGKRTSYVEFENAGHLQFTIGLDHDVISYVLYRLNLGEKEGYHGLKTEKKEPQRRFGYTNVDTSNRSYLTLSWCVCWKRRWNWA